MKKYLLPPNGNFYKANLHCHSTVSDGWLTPEELKDRYMSLGYSVVAFSDHGVMVPHPELRDENFLPLTAIEYDVANPDSSSPRGETCHFNFIALDEKMDTQILWHREKYILKHTMHSKGLVKFDDTLPDYEREYTPECISEMMTKGREANFFVTYNHPAWSYETYPEYINYNGMHAMEIMNHLSVVGRGIFDYNDVIYDEMLRAGKRIFCIAADDTHAKYPMGSRKCDIGGAYTMIKADKLDYKSIADALKKGNFYSSEGPEIKSLWYEDGKLCIECAPADSIIFTTYPKRGEAFFAENGELLTYGEFTVRETDKYIRVTVVSENGKRAYTNAYFIDELT